MKKTDLRNLTITEMEQLALTLSEKKYRGRQLYEWINKHGVTTFEEMTNLPAALITKITATATLPTLAMKKKLISEDKFTTKFLFSASKSDIIEDEADSSNGEILFESVLLRYNHGNTICISSQAGCRMGCIFCASAKSGFIRNLTPGEMAAQVYAIAKEIGEPINNIVLMGCGEPLDNFVNTVKFITIINSHEGANIGRRHITISTCGLADEIYDLMENDISISLAVSLHAPNDTIRKKLMPITKKHPTEDLLKACKAYSDKTKRRISFEYSLIEDINDSTKHAEELAALLRNMLCHVNLIPFNISEHVSQFKPSNKETIEKFAKTLNTNNIETTIRRRLGSDIGAACGQLVSKYQTDY